MSTYAYVNPIVAVTLGVVVLDEPLTPGMCMAARSSWRAVALIVSAGGAASGPRTPETPARRRREWPKAQTPARSGGRRSSAEV